MSKFKVGDIVKVRDWEDMAIEGRNLIWERKKKKEMTIAEIEKELGYSVKIVKEK